MMKISKIQPMNSQSFRRLVYLLALAMVATAGSAVLASPVMAEVVYTPVNVSISGNGLLKIDLNHDGIVDVSIVSSGKSIFCAGTGPGSFGLVYGLPAQGNGMVANGNYVLALNSGLRISSSSFFYSAEGLMMQYSSCIWPPHSNYGAWLEVSNRYLGLKFQINGHSHYGWARLSMTVGRFGPITTLTGYAYETVAGQGITTGQTSGP
jgi:hypothetical protein